MWLTIINAHTRAMWRRQTRQVVPRACPLPAPSTAFCFISHTPHPNVSVAALVPDTGEGGRLHGRQLPPPRGLRPTVSCQRYQLKELMGAKGAQLFTSTRTTTLSTSVGVIDSHASVWLRSEDPAFSALPRLQCSPKTFRGERRWLHSAFFLSFSSDNHTLLGTPPRRPAHHPSQNPPAQGASGQQLVG